MLLYLIASVLLACHAKVTPETNRKKVPVDYNLEVVVKYALSNKIDLVKGLYTVFFMGKPQTDIKFKLSPSEKQRIIEKYYSLALYELNEVNKTTGTVYIEDECMIMPKFYTYLTFKKDSLTQNIQIDEDCDEYNSSDISEAAERVKEFIRFFNGIIRTKPEIKNAPASNIIYL